MEPKWWSAAEEAIENSLSEFSNKLQDDLETLDPGKLVERKNPFLFCARSRNDVDLLSNMLLDAFLSSSEETKFGGVLEEVAIMVCGYAKGGRKSSAEGIDLEYDQNSIRHMIQIKSGVNWGNSSQKKKLKDNFNSATRVLRQGNTQIDVRCIEGVCYGKSSRSDKGSHIQLVGNEFWYDISDWNETAYAIMEVIRKHTGNGMVELRENARRKIVQYLKDEGIVLPNNELDWKALLKIVMKD